MVTVDFSGTVCKLMDDQAKLLAENLRNWSAFRRGVRQPVAGEAYAERDRVQSLS